MNPPKNVLQLLIASQIFSLVFLMLMPIVIRWLSVPLGKTLYALLVVVSV